MTGEMSAYFAETLDWTEDNVERNNRIIKEFLNRQIAQSEEKRIQYWSGNDSIQENRKYLRFITGIRDERVKYDTPMLCETLAASALFGDTPTHKIYAIKWPVFDLFYGEGLLLEPKGVPASTETIIYLPHAGVSPEAVLGLDEAPIDIYFQPPEHNQRMVIPVIVDRNTQRRPQSEYELTNREFLYRAAFQMGRHIIGYEVQEILALLDWLKKQPGSFVRLAGQGDGGLLALYAAAMDIRVDEAVVIDYFYKRDRLCEEPIDREVFGLIERFGDAEIASLIAPRKLTVLKYSPPIQEFTSETGGAPGKLQALESQVIQSEVLRAQKIAAAADWISYQKTIQKPRVPKVSVIGQWPDMHVRMQRVINGMDRHTQALLHRSPATRREFWSSLDESTPEHIAETMEWYRDDFARNVIGVYDEQYTALNPKTRLFKQDENYTVYEVELDVYADLKVNGTLLIPQGMKAGETRPVMVCQHGLERSSKAHIRGCGLPGDTVFFSEVCEMGYIVFAPQGIYSLGDRFRFLQRQSHSMGRSMFAVMRAQYAQTLAWLETLPFVQQDNIGLYGVSYGGLTAMYLTPLIPQFQYTICSANFNYWNNKCVNSLLHIGEGYVHDNQYEMFEFNMGNTYDHSDMAKMIAPRFFLVERGHLDGAARSETVGYEFGKVRYFYDHCMRMPQRADILWMDGGHTTYVGKSVTYLKERLKHL